MRAKQRFIAAILIVLLLCALLTGAATESVETQPVSQKGLLKGGLTACSLTCYVCAVMMLSGMIYELEKKHRTKAVISGIVMLLLAVSGAITTVNGTGNEDVLSSSQTVSSDKAQKTTVSPQPTEVPEEEESESWTVTLLGECTVGTLLEWQDSDASYNMLSLIGDDYSYPFSNVKQYFENDALTVADCEGVFTDTTEAVEKDYRFSAAPEYAQVFSDAGIDVVSLANNHVGDYGEIGVQNTIAALDFCGVKWTNSGIPFIAQIPDGPTIGIISYNSVEDDDGDDVETLKTVRAMCQNCREQGCDLVIAYIHWGQAFFPEPEENTVELARAVVDMGCDLVIGGHANVLQRMEYYNEVPIYYSLGSFCYGGNSNPSDKDTVILCQQIVKDTDGKYRLGDASYIPCRISTTDDANDFRPTPYPKGTEAYDRVLAKLTVTQ